MPQTLNASNTDLYSDAADNTAAPPPEDQTPAEDKGEGHKSTVVPLSALGEGVKPGDKCTFEVVRVHDTQAEIRYLEDEEEGDGYHDEEPASMPKRDMESMME